MESGGKGKQNGAVGLVAVDLIDRMCGGGRRRRSRLKSGSSSLCGFQQGYSRLEGGSNCREHSACVDLPPIIESVDERCDSSADEEDGEENERMLLLLHQQQRPRLSISCDEYSSKRWMSSTTTDHYSSHRRRKGFSCMRLRIVNMVRLVAMMRKVRLAYRRMMSAAAASKTILSLSDIYNDIADLIPVPCRDDTTEARTIVVIRPIKYQSGASEDDRAAETPIASTSAHACSRASTSAHACSRATTSAHACSRATSSAHACSSSSSSGHSIIARRPDDHVAKSGPMEGVADQSPSSSWRKFALRSFSCVCASNITSWTSI